MKRLFASFATLLVAMVATLALAQQSSGPEASPADLAKQEQQRAVTQPYNNAPVWKNARGAVEGYASIPAPEAGVLIQEETFEGGVRFRPFLARPQSASPLALSPRTPRTQRLAKCVS